MSHIPLLHRSYHDIPRLQPPRRGPQVCACVILLLVACAVFAGLPSHAVFSLETRNVTLPIEAQRILMVETAMEKGEMSFELILNSQGRDEILSDLIGSVSYLLKENSRSR